MLSRNIIYIRSALACLVLVACPVFAMDWFGWMDSKQAQQVQVAEPFINVHSGPGRGYPVTHVFIKGEDILITKEKAGWYYVSGLVAGGWVERETILRTLDPDGGTVQFSELQRSDFSRRQYDLGVMAGSFEGATSLSLNLGYAFTRNISAELSVEQVLGEFSQIQILGVNLQHQPFPDWWISPYFSLGSGAILVKPRATLVQESNRHEDFLNLGIGSRIYITDRYFIRLEYRNYTIFTDRNENEEAEAWKLGLSVFY